MMSGEEDYSKADESYEESEVKRRRRRRKFIFNT
jgi:hypothetical protein